MVENEAKSINDIIIEILNYMDLQKRIFLNDNDYQRVKKVEQYMEDVLYYKKSLEEVSVNNLRVLGIQEKERQRIARDLHDTSLQNLTHLVHKLELSAKYIDTDIIQAKLEIASINKNLREIIQEIRNTIFDLRPMSFDDLGLRESIERLINNLEMIHKIEIELKMNDITCDNPLILMTVFRIIHECTTNAVSHSNGDKVLIELLEKKNTLSIYIQDNGIGFEYKKMKGEKDKHFGLEILEERVLLLNGSLKIDSSSNGTKIYIVVPNF